MGPTTTTSIRKIGGTNPGVLDKTQPSRLLRVPDAKLSFAAFDPRVASATPVVPDLRKLSLNEDHYPPRRVVIETQPSGENYWRFVPSARKEDGVEHEGSWPRIIDICGELVECTLDQWDIYKLDPVYDCYVRASPAPSIISRVTPSSNAPYTSPSGKRRLTSSSPQPEIHINQKRRTQIVFDTSSEEDSEEYEVEEMIVDDGIPLRRATSLSYKIQTKNFRDEIAKHRQERREKISRRAEKVAQKQIASQEGSTFFIQEFQRPKDVPPEAEAASKRKVTSLLESLRPSESIGNSQSSEQDSSRKHANYEQVKDGKRTRTLSPSGAKRELDAKRLKREKPKKQRREQELQARRRERDKKLINEVIAEVEQPDETTNDTEGYDAKYDIKPIEPVLDSRYNTGSCEEEDLRQAAINESRRKLAELEADRPLWEEQAKKRAMREKAEEEARRAKSEERKLKEEAEKRMKRQLQEEKDKAMKQEVEEKARRERERRQRAQRWSIGAWTIQRALERYKVLSESFDSTKFSDREPLSRDAVPWPTLHSPTAFSVEDVDWDAVESFFDAVRPHMRPQDYKTFVEKSHRRFHPDRWRSRSLLKTVVDESERGCMEVAANTVAQALTPIWRQITGR